MVSTVAPFPSLVRHLFYICSTFVLHFKSEEQPKNNRRTSVEQTSKLAVCGAIEKIRNKKVVHLKKCVFLKQEIINTNAMKYITKNLKTSGLRYLGILVVLAGIASMPGVNAQSIYTAEHFFPSCNGTNAIVRENSVGLPVVQYQNAQGVNFVYGDPSIGNVRNFVIPVLY